MERKPLPWSENEREGLPPCPMCLALNIWRARRKEVQIQVMLLFLDFTQLKRNRLAGAVNGKQLEFHRQV